MGNLSNDLLLETFAELLRRGIGNEITPEFTLVNETFAKLLRRGIVNEIIPEFTSVNEDVSSLAITKYKEFCKGLK